MLDLAGRRWLRWQVLLRLRTHVRLSLPPYYVFFPRSVARQPSWRPPVATPLKRPSYLAVPKCPIESHSVPGHSSQRGSNTVHGTSRSQLTHLRLLTRPKRNVAPSHDANAGYDPLEAACGAHPEDGSAVRPDVGEAWVHPNLKVAPEVTAAFCTNRTPRNRNEL